MHWVGCKEKHGKGGFLLGSGGVWLFSPFPESRGDVDDVDVVDDGDDDVGVDDVVDDDVDVDDDDDDDVCIVYPLRFSGLASDTRRCACILSFAFNRAVTRL